MCYIAFSNNFIFKSLDCIIQLQSETYGHTFKSAVTKSSETTLKSVESKIVIRYRQKSISIEHLLRYC